jgi:hypothetical protein
MSRRFIAAVQQSKCIAGNHQSSRIANNTLCPRGKDIRTLLWSERMSSINRFIQITEAFDPEATQILGRAFDMACALLGRSVQPVVIREAIARNIVEAARHGERDPHRLRDAGLTALNHHNNGAA